MNSLFIFVQYLLPHHLFTRLVGWSMGRRVYRRALIRFFIRRYRVDMSEAARPDVEDYESFNDFFTRHLCSGARPLPSDPFAVACPVDGTISELGRIEQDRLLQAKGHNYSLDALLAGDSDAASRFANGSFATIYLAPRDYHRVHMPLSGTLQSTTYIPGRLFSVNPVTAAAVPNLFARNERLVCQFDTVAGPMAVILVGAMIVAGIETSWSGTVCPGAPQRVNTIRYSDDIDTIELQRGDELGLFKVGSTVIVLFSEQGATLESGLIAGTKVKMGQLLAMASNKDTQTQG